MFANRYTALVDACSLVSLWRRNLLLTLAEAEFFRIRWSRPILDETQKALAGMFENRGLADASARAQRSIAAMTEAFPEAMVEDFDIFQSVRYGLPDPGDEHVLAAAVKTEAHSLVTENLKDFPADLLAKVNIEARSADDFIADTISLEEGKGVAAVRLMRTRMQRPEMQPEELLRSLEAHGLVETASILASHVGAL